MKPYLLLDIDGVLSPLGQLPHEDYALWEGDWATFRVPYATVVALHGLKGKVQLVNSSSWGEEAAGLFRYMGLSVADTLDFSSAKPHEWSKEAGLRAFVAAHPGEPIIVVDDEFSSSFKAWAEEQPHLDFLSTRGELGLTPSDFLVVEFMIARATSPRA